jgi:hypothetical protein
MTWLLIVAAIYLVGAMLVLAWALWNDEPHELAALLAIYWPVLLVVAVGLYLLHWAGLGLPPERLR